MGTPPQPTRTVIAPSATRPRPAVVTWAVGLSFAYALSVVAKGVMTGLQDGRLWYWYLPQSLIIALALAVPAIFVFMGKRAARVITWVVASMFLLSTFAAIRGAGKTSAIDELNRPKLRRYPASKEHVLSGLR